ncbi:MAG: type IX secretion system protein PorQ [Ignavibacteriae bacterium]|nr:type IX secretion system protein PorQ [Ignavibacteriota bacterium]
MKNILFTFCLFCCFTPLLFAGGTYDFLRQDVGARAAALGGNFVSVANDPNIIFYNPAGLATLENNKLSFGYFKHLLDINSGHASYSRNINNFGSVGLGLLYTNYGEFQMTGEEGQDLGTFNAGDFAAVLGYGAEMENGLQYGVNSKFIFSSIGGYQSTAVAVDLGVRYVVSPQSFILGASVTNIGAQLDPYINTRENLPLNVQVGATIYPEHVPAAISIGFSKMNEQQDNILDRFKTFAVGIEFTASENVALRFGYNNEKRRELKLGTSSGLAGFSIGAGFQSELYMIDYAFNSLGKIGSIHRVSLGININ